MHQVANVPHIPRAAQWLFTLWMLFWVTVILFNQGPQNFFWLCNMAKFIVLYAIWRGDRLLLSSQVGVVTIVGLGWGLDFLTGLALGGHSPTGFTNYMFGDELSLLARSTSLYHLGLPPFLLWLILRVGYDRRGPWLQCGIGAVAVVGAWLFTEPVRNVNWVWEPFGVEQTWMPDPLWVLVLILAYPLVLYFPGHWLVLQFRRWMKTGG
ncbi:hypothetical protein [Natronospira bacteriovora]|uniref:Membrane-associated protein n=1 Tax=Natronospira bacteriovora TaxID=3069753 RepID=A0ABU0W7L1_9GAMM|nr:hypothetical protein [Natronospira sp. AB-CW4]MDQ2070012.1 hypothetical protein [Natronospira sp. AB-CW4]